VCLEIRHSRAPRALGCCFGSRRAVSVSCFHHASCANGLFCRQCVENEARHALGRDVLDRISLVVDVLQRAASGSIVSFARHQWCSQLPTPYTIPSRLWEVSWCRRVEGQGGTASNLLFLLSNDVRNRQSRARKYAPCLKLFTTNNSRAIAGVDLSREGWTSEDQLDLR
jgi:hypothetical protein